MTSFTYKSWLLLIDSTLRSVRKEMLPENFVTESELPSELPGKLPAPDFISITHHCPHPLTRSLSTSPSLHLLKSNSP